GGIVIWWGVGVAGRWGGGGGGGCWGREGGGDGACRAGGAPRAARRRLARVGISLAERGRASTLVFAAGNDAPGAVPALDWELLARAEGTLVFYVSVDALGPIT